MAPVVPEAATWSLVTSDPGLPAPELTFAPKLSNGSTETVLSVKDGRTPVDAVHFAPGGKYRCKSASSVLSFSELTLTSYREALFSFRVRSGRCLGHGYRLACQA